MKLKKFLIAGGNSTLLVEDYPSGGKKEIIKKYLGEVEQIGFVETKNGLPFLNMMGGELCINGTIALASTLGKKGELKTSGYDGVVQYQNKGNATQISLSLPYKIIKNKILLSGIGYILIWNKELISKEYLDTFCKKYNLPAFGALIVKNNVMYPYVYVKSTNSLFEETACGSGSIALSILAQKESVIQPTGKTITVKNNNNAFSINAEVTIIGKGYG